MTDDLFQQCDITLLYFHFDVLRHYNVFGSALARSSFGISVLIAFKVSPLHPWLLAGGSILIAVFSFLLLQLLDITLLPPIKTKPRQLGSRSDLSVSSLAVSAQDFSCCSARCGVRGYESRHFSLKLFHILHTTISLYQLYHFLCAKACNVCMQCMQHLYHLWGDTLVKCSPLSSCVLFIELTRHAKDTKRRVSFCLTFKCGHLEQIQICCANWFVTSKLRS